MAIKLFEPSLGEVPKKLRHLYALDQERGGYRLDVSDLADYERGLRNALAVERATVKEQRLLITELRRQNEVVSLGGG